MPCALKGGTELIGLSTLMSELKLNAILEILGDSSACHGTLHREGSGKVKHLELKQLWLQGKVKEGTIRYVKIPRDQNPSDSFTKNWGPDGKSHFCLSNFEVLPN